MCTTAAESANRNGSPRIFQLLLLCFFLSGFAALLYQTAWTREFAVAFGTSDLAVVAVLAAYMAGLAAGAWVGGRLALRMRRPILVYGLLELGIALFALTVPWAIRLASQLYVAMFSSGAALPESTAISSAAFHLVCAFFILLPCTGLMGATLPLLVRHAVRSEQELGRRIGTLYATNTAGAIAGTICAAFLLLPAVGLRSTIYFGVATNALVFIVAAILARTAPLPQLAATSPLSEGDFAARSTWILPVVALSGVTSFAYEVVWTRLLTQVLGTDVFAFATMLSSFLFGIALGSAVAGKVASTRQRAAFGFCVSQLGIAVLTLLAFFAVDWLPAISIFFGQGMWTNFLLSAAILLPGTFCIGAVFPFATRILARDVFEAASATAQVFAWNTVGAITGAIAAGFFGLPMLGFSGTVLVAASINCLLAVGVALLAGLPRSVTYGVAVAGVVALWFTPAEPWRLLRHTIQYSPGWSSPLTDPREGIEYYGVGRNATVLLFEAHGEWELRANGLVESYIQRPGTAEGKYLPERMLTALPVLARPNSRTLLMVGMGGGNAIESIPAAFEQIDVVELEPKIIEACRAIGARRRHDPLADARVDVHINDARSALALTQQKYDAIVSQPSYPWSAGASHLYTLDFFRLVRQRLTDSGVFVQWVGVGLVDESLVKTCVATLLEVFPHVEVYLTRGSLLFLASSQPIDLKTTVPQAVASEPEFFSRLGVFGPMDVLADQVLEVDEARRFAEGAPISSDDHNRFATYSARLTSSLGMNGADALFARFLPLDGRHRDLDQLYLIRRLSANAGTMRANNLAQSIEQPLDKMTAQAILALRNGDGAKCLALVREVLDAQPSHHEARAALFELWRGEMQRRDSPLPAPLDKGEGTPGEATMIEAVRFERDDDWEALRAMDSRLAAIAPEDPLFTAAIRLRVAWRCASGDPALGQEAVDLLEPLQSTTMYTTDHLLRARACAVAGNVEGALAIMAELGAFLTPDQRHLAAQAHRLLNSMPVDSRLTKWRDQILSRLREISFGGP